VPALPLATIAASGWLTSCAIELASSPSVTTRVTRASSSFERSGLQRAKACGGGDGEVRPEQRIRQHVLDHDALSRLQGNAVKAIEEVLLEAALGDDFQGMRLRVVELDIAEVGVVQGDRGIEPADKSSSSGLLKKAQMCCLVRNSDLANRIGWASWRGFMGSVSPDRTVSVTPWPAKRHYTNV
jgi:hypothetical protein